MKKLFLFLIAVGIAFSFSFSAQAQGAARKPDETVLRDDELESEAKHNLEVARHYFKLKKAYVASLSRCEEIIAAYPLFSKMDEVLYIAGVSSLRLADGKGKQRAKKTPEQLRDDARIYLSQLVNDFSQSEFKAEAEKELAALGGALKKKE
jgi:outer membrane protein assembly factor BamD (BamD/ComL family)